MPLAIASGSGTQLLGAGTERTHLLVLFDNHHAADFVTVKVGRFAASAGFDINRSVHSRTLAPGASGYFYLPHLPASERLVGWASQASAVTMRVDDGDVELTPDEVVPPPAPTRETVTLALTAETNGANVGAFGQHRSPIPAGLLTPRTFTIAGQTYGVRGWYTDSAPQLVLNFDSDAEEAAFRAAGLTLDLGQGDSFLTSAMTATHGVLTHAVAAGYQDRMQYTITLQAPE